MTERTSLNDSPGTPVQTTARVLSDDEKLRLKRDKNPVSDFKQKKLEVEAQKNWDLFYKRNTTKFFKDRHWTKREFTDLISNAGKDEGPLVVFEVGCGVGNFMFPLLEEDKHLYFHACDFSKRAVQFVQEHPLYDSDRCNAFHCDITEGPLTNQVPASSVDVSTMIFVLSAIHPNKMVQALQNIYSVLKPGGILLFRDYGLYDYAMLRFAPGHKLEENFYVRQDGTRAYYFSLEKLQELMHAAGFAVVENGYVHRETVNKKEGICVPRIFVQGKFVKTDTSEVHQIDDGLVKLSNEDQTETSVAVRDLSINCDDRTKLPITSDGSQLENSVTHGNCKNCVNNSTKLDSDGNQVDSTVVVEETMCGCTHRDDSRTELSSTCSKIDNLTVAQNGILESNLESETNKKEDDKSVKNLDCR